jgi:hypothetical protein
MTCAIAVVEGEDIEAGADSALCGPEEIYQMQEDKVFVRGPYLIGYCGRARIGQILRYRLDFPDPPDDGDLTSFLIRGLASAIRRAVEAEGAAGRGRDLLGEKTVLILGCRARLWCIQPDLSIAETTPFAAIGSGRHKAYGALHSLTAADVQPARRRIELALEAAAQFTPSVRPPFRFVTLKSTCTGQPTSSTKTTAASPAAAATPADGTVARSRESADMRQPLAR